MVQSCRGSKRRRRKREVEPCAKLPDEGATATPPRLALSVGSTGWACTEVPAGTVLPEFSSEGASSSLVPSGACVAGSRAGASSELPVSSLSPRGTPDSSRPPVSSPTSLAPSGVEGGADARFPSLGVRVEFKIPESWIIKKCQIYVLKCLCEFHILKGMTKGLK